MKIAVQVLVIIITTFYSGYLFVRVINGGGDKELWINEQRLTIKCRKEFCYVDDTAINEISLSAFCESFYKN